jgi:hypothetical protein
MTRKLDRDGRPIEDDDDGVLRDGETFRVPMMLRDGSTVDLEPWQADVIHAHRLGLDDGLALHKPGPRYCTDQVDLDAKAKAYADGVREMCDAWKRPPPSIEAKANTAPPKQDAVPRAMTMDEAQRIRDRAWLESVAELESALKGPSR